MNGAKVRKMKAQRSDGKRSSQAKRRSQVRRRQRQAKGAMRQS